MAALFGGGYRNFLGGFGQITQLKVGTNFWWWTDRNLYKLTAIKCEVKRTVEIGGKEVGVLYPMPVYNRPRALKTYPFLSSLPSRRAGTTYHILLRFLRNL